MEFKKASEQNPTDDNEYYDSEDSEYLGEKMEQLQNQIMDLL